MEYNVIFICRLSGTYDYHASQPFNYQNFMGDPPYCLPNNLCDVSLENLELDQPIILSLIFFLIFITCLLNLYHTKNVRKNSV